MCLVVFFVILSLNFAATTKDESTMPMLDGRIVGGLPVDIDSFPWQLSLRLGLSHICGASIISANWAVTAAHCVVGLNDKSLNLRAGSSFSNSGGIVHSISRIIAHSSFNSNTIDYDIAVIQVTSNFNVGTTGIHTIGLPPAGYRPAVGVSCVVSGWGSTKYVLRHWEFQEGGTASTQLMAVIVPIISQETCRSFYGTSTITDRMLCAGYTTGSKDSCQGDSGGPLVFESQLIGIVSWGNGCARPEYPGVYTSVGNFRSWIYTRTGV